ncbi:MAG: TetR/AcrR family transcriptional regulator [Chitinophagaceae bacterium]
MATTEVSLVLRSFFPMQAKERIIQAARNEFLRYGIRSVSMDDIAAQLGMSKKTIYQSFVDKEQLVDAVIENEIAAMQRDCLSAIAHSRDAVDEIFITMKLSLEQIRNMNPVALHDLQKFHVGPYQRIKQHNQEFLLHLIAANIDRGKQEGLYRKEVNAEVLSRFRLESLMVIFNPELFPPAHYNLVDTSREIIEHYVYGLATEKGQQLIEAYKQEIVK